MRSPGFINVFLLLLIAFIWASAFGIIKIVVYETGPVTLAAVRSSIAAVILLVLLRLKGPFDWPLYRRYALPLLLIGGVGTALPFMMIPWAELYLESSLTALLMSIGPIATLLGAWVFGLEDQINFRRVGGILIGLSGAAMLLSDGFVTMGRANLLAQLVAMMAALCYVLGNLTVRRIKDVHWLVVSAMGLSISSILLWPFAYFLEAPQPATWSSTAWQGLLWLGAISTAFAFSVRYFLIGRAGPSFSSYVGYLIPAMAVLLGYVFLDEALTAIKILSLCAILTGLLLARRTERSEKEKND